MRNRIAISNSIMNRFFPEGEEQAFCAYRFKKCILDREFREKSSEAMDKGKYFEYLCLGAGADPDDMVTDLPRLKNGNKSAEQERIDGQAIVFQRLLEEFGITMSAVQQKVFREWEHENNIWMETHEVIINGTLDFVADINTMAMNQNQEEVALSLEGCVHDLKLTGDIWMQYGRLCWAYPWSGNHSQVSTYHYITGRPFCYWVFDYKPKTEFRLWHHDPTPIEMMEFHETVRKTVEKYIDLEEKGWPASPAYYRCEGCPVVTCQKRTTKPAFLIF